MIQDQIQKQLAPLLSLFLLVVTVFFGVLTWRTIHTATSPQPSEHSISVQGIGTVSTTPDLAVITFGVRIEAETTEDAQAQNTQTTNTLLAALRRAGIEDKDLRTQNYSLYENTIWNPETGEQESRGWIVDQNIEIKVRNSASIGDIIALASTSGVTNVSGPLFEQADISEYQAEARLEAIANARTQAEAIADSLGVSLGEVTSYSEWNVNEPIPFYAAYDRMEFAGVGGVAPDISLGESEVSMEVSITFSIK